jgi:peptidoglycan/LPS O-acetylase OafA/YrhL
MRYRADVDGLRAVSIILVLAFHLGLNGGGFVGVDVFFVISGYLITGLIYGGMEDQKFTLKGFYERRARRILPALITVVLATAAAGYVLLYPGDYATFGRSALFALVGLSNVFFLDNTGYFDLPSQSMPLLHTWSLGVEEQFYVCWPALLLAGRKIFGRSSRGWCWLLTAIIVASFAAALFQVQRDPKAAFYLPYTRAWELALGGLLVFLPQIRSRASEAFPLLGLALIVGSSVYLNATDPFPGLNALAPVIGAALVIYPISTVCGRLLARLSPLGLISYSLYLWHWPVIVFWRIYMNGVALSFADIVLIVGFSVGLSILSWMFVEQPFRKARFRSVLTVAVVAELVAAVVIAPIVATAGVPARVPASALRLGDRNAMWAWQCPQMLDVGLLRDPDTSSSHETCIIGAPWASANRHALVWGDSNAEAILPLLNLGALRHDTSVAVVDICPAILHEGVVQRYWPEQPGYNQYCEASRAAVLRLLDGKVSIDLVILAASWSNLPSVLRLNGRDRSRSSERDDPGGLIAFSEGLNAMRHGFDDLLPRISKNRRVVVFADIPKWENELIGCVLALVALPRRPCASELSIPNYDAKRQHDVLRSVAEQNHVIAYSPEDYLCGADGCRMFINGEFIYRDSEHFRRDLAPATLEQLSDLMQIDKLFSGLDATRSKE